MAHLEHDMVCLIDSFVYLKDDSYQQIQALDLLAEMCLQENGPDLMKKTKGLSTVLNMLLQKKVDINILPNALYTLGNAVLHSGLGCIKDLRKYILGFPGEPFTKPSYCIQVIKEVDKFVMCCMKVHLIHRPAIAEAKEEM